MHLRPYLACMIQKDDDDDDGDLIVPRRKRRRNPLLSSRPSIGSIYGVHLFFREKRWKERKRETENNRAPKKHATHDQAPTTTTPNQNQSNHGNTTIVLFKLRWE